jgi:hypothetical protein
MTLFAGCLADHIELHHVLQSLRHSGRREGELFGCRWDRDDRLALKVLLNPQNRGSGAGASTARPGGKTMSSSIITAEIFDAFLK